jgi:AraC-like DNA-binding protein
LLLLRALIPAWRTCTSNRFNLSNQGRLIQPPATFSNNINLSHFSRLFRERLDVPPMAYRQAGLAVR